MGATLQNAMPSRGDGPPPSMEGMLGGPPQAAPPTDMQGAMKASMDMFRDLMTKVKDMASQHPEAAEEFNTVTTALRNALQKVTSKLTRNQEGPQPVTLG